MNVIDIHKLLPFI